MPGKTKVRPGEEWKAYRPRPEKRITEGQGEAILRGRWQHADGSPLANYEASELAGCYFAYCKYEWPIGWRPPVERKRPIKPTASRFIHWTDWEAYRRGWERRTPDTAPIKLRREV